MEIKAADVMKLRKMTGAGMMDCKKALAEAEGDFARAQDIIREKGKLVVAKRADRTATEGVVVTKIVGQKGYILCLACETDFVAQNAEYSASANAMLDVAVKTDAADRDALLVRILQQAPQAVIALKPFMTPDLAQPMWSRRVMEAARRGGVADRLRIIPPLAYGRDLMDFLAMADIQLDSYPYGGWTTNMEAVYAGLAIVTQEGEQARSRWGAHILRALGVSAGIARTLDEYVAQAVELVQNSTLREQVRRQIRQNALPTLFNGAAAQPAYEEALLQMHAAAVAKTERAVRA